MSWQKSVRISFWIWNLVKTYNNQGKTWWREKLLLYGRSVVAFYIWTHHSSHSMWWPRLLALVASARNLFSKMWLWTSICLVAPSRTSGKASYFFIQGWGGFCWKHLEAQLLASAAWGKRQHLWQVIEQEARERRVWKEICVGIELFKASMCARKSRKPSLRHTLSSLAGLQALQVGTKLRQSCQQPG